VNYERNKKGARFFETQCSFGHLILMLSLHYLVKCRLLSLLFASDVNVCRLHSRWKKTFCRKLSGDF